METTAPISLYLDLKKGEAASIEVVARAALAWAAAIKELSFVIDPSIEVQIELISGSEGSLDLNACIRAISKFATDHPQLTTIIVTALTWFSVQTGAYTYEKILDYLTGSDAPVVVQKLSREDIEILARAVERAHHADVAGTQKRQIFKELEQDKSISGVGSTQERDKKPSVIVPRSEFPMRSGRSTVVEVESKRKTEVETVPVILISPTLKDAERRWRFQIGTLPEFGATMKDREFLEALAAGRVALPLRAGVEMTVEMETKIELVGQVWEVRERNILKVLRPGLLEDPTRLPFPPRNP